MQRRYEVCTDPNTGQPKLRKLNSHLVYVCDEDLFDAILEIHEESGHGARDVMNARSKKKYANVTKDVLQMFADTCDVCRVKKKKRKVIFCLLFLLVWEFFLRECKIYRNMYQTLGKMQRSFFG